MPISIDFVEDFLLSRKLSAERYLKILTRIKNLSTANLVLGDQDLRIILDDMSSDLFEAVKKLEANKSFLYGAFPIRDYFPSLRLTLDEEKSFLSSLLGETSQITVIAKQIPGGAYPPNFSNGVDVWIYGDKSLPRSFQIVKEGMPIGYGAMILAMYEYAKTLQKRRQKRMKKILTKFCSHYFDQSDLARAAQLENSQRE